MGYIKESEGIDFLIESKPLTNKEKKEKINSRNKDNSKKEGS